MLCDIHYTNTILIYILIAIPMYIAAPDSTT